MREILFRGKTDKGEWVQGDLLHEGYDYDVAIWERETKLVTEVIPETVGQFTGLTDKNDKKIFEGDIVSNEVFRASVKFYNGRFCPFNSEYHTFYADDCEVIGNIHDNPELLGGE